MYPYTLESTELVSNVVKNSKNVASQMVEYTICLKRMNYQSCVKCGMITGSVNNHKLCSSHTCSLEVTSFLRKIKF